MFGRGYENWQGQVPPKGTLLQELVNRGISDADLGRIVWFNLSNGTEGTPDVRGFSGLGGVVRKFVRQYELASRERQVGFRGVRRPVGLGALVKRGRGRPDFGAVKRPFVRSRGFGQDDEYYEDAFDEAGEADFTPEEDAWLEANVPESSMTPTTSWEPYPQYPQSVDQMAEDFISGTGAPSASELELERTISEIEDQLNTDPTSRYANPAPATAPAQTASQPTSQGQSILQQLQKGLLDLGLKKAAMELGITSLNKAPTTNANNPPTAGDSFLTQLGKMASTVMLSKLGNELDLNEKATATKPISAAPRTTTIPKTTAPQGVTQQYGILIGVAAMLLIYLIATRQGGDIFGGHGKGRRRK